MRVPRTSPRPLAAVALAACAALAPGCRYFTRPMVGVRHVGSEKVVHQLESSALTGESLSATAQLALHYFGLTEDYAKDPAAALVALHARAMAPDSLRSFLYAIAELSYDTARRLESREHYLAAAVYAYGYLLDEGWSGEPNPYDRTFRWACEIYNRGLREALMSDDRSQLHVVAGRWKLPVGHLDVALRENDPSFSIERTRLISADEYEVWGLSMRVRDSGLGVPFIAASNVDKKDARDARRAFVPGSAFLRLSGGVKEIESGLGAVLELRSAYEPQDLVVGKHAVPLEADFSTALGLGLHESSMWSSSLTGFFDSSRAARENELLMIRPYQAGRVPVVFVHGTAANPGNWAEMFNLLMADPRLRERCQFWFYQYSTGNPILLSAANLRTELTQLVAELDPAGKDAALHHMVLVGHSQGGILCKLQVVDGDVSWWEKLTDTPLSESGLSPANEATLRSVLDFEPLPFVDRAVFLATPHRGSYLADYRLASFVNRLIDVPGEVVSLSKALQEDERFRRVLKSEIPTSIDGMKPSNRFVKLLAATPIAPGVTTHSIIPIGDADPADPQDASDGIVKYESAHIEGVASELRIPGGHSCQTSSSAIRELRRILREHLEAVGERP